MFTFDLSSVVCDVAWAPFASTVFDACTADGKVGGWCGVGSNGGMCAHTHTHTPNVFGSKYIAASVTKHVRCGVWQLLMQPYLCPLLLQIHVFDLNMSKYEPLCVQSSEGEEVWADTQTHTHTHTYTCPVLSCPVLSCPVLSCPVLFCCCRYTVKQAQ